MPLPSVATTGPNAAWERTTARSLAEVDALRPAWATFQFERVDADIDFFTTVVRTRPEVVRPHVVLLGDEHPRAIAVGRIEDVQLTASIGYRVLARPRVRSLTLVPGGVVGAEALRESEMLLEELLACLARSEADVLVLPALQTDSTLYTAATSAVPRLRREGFVDAVTHRRLRLPASLDDLLAGKSRKSRGNLRRQEAHFLEAHPDTSLDVLSRPEDEKRIFHDLEAVAARTYQRGLGVAFHDTEEQRAVVRLGLARGWYRAYVLSVGGAPVAFWPGVAYNRTFFVSTPGYDPAYAEHNVGTLVLLRVIESLCADAGVDALDYGFGDADYKRRFANESWEEADVRIFAPTFRAVRVNAVNTGIGSSVRLAKRALGGERADRLKKVWRGRLAKHAAR
jgi:Acetyltransferase (GNAT) domain